MKKEVYIYGGIALGITALIVLIVKKSRSAAPMTVNSLINDKISAKYAAANKKLIDTLNPAERNTFINFINDIEKKGYAVVITSAGRSTADQVRQKKANAKNATPGFSTHEYGIALDINLVKDGKWINKDSSVEAWKKTGVVDLAETKYKMRWGGDGFKGYHDPVHFDLGKKYDINKLYAKALKQYGSVAKIEGTKMSLTV